MLKVDLHIHTWASGHAHNTILEYINRAKELKMKIVGFSDHGPAKGFISDSYFKTLTRIPKVVNGIRILKGIEANVLKNGELDIADKLVERLDYVIAGFHTNTSYKDAGIKANTKAMVNAIRSGKVDIISHPVWTENFITDVEIIAEEACKHDVLLEINIQYLTERKLRQNTVIDLKKIIEIIKRNRKKVIVNSDAHNIWEMADDAPLKKIQKEIGLNSELVINYSPKELLQFLNIK